MAPAMQHDDPQFTNTLPSGGLLAGGDEGARAPAPEHKPLEPGDMIGRYRVREHIGEGGMGVVYAAEDPELGRVVAIKLLRAVQGAEAEREQRRMLREAQALARVSHRNLVMVFDVGSLRGRVWIAMEYVAGETLETWLSREHRSWSEIVGVFAEAGRGLAAVHAAGLVHRDFKPGNVIVRKDGAVQVLDFGLAAPLGDVAERDPDAALDRRASPDLDALAATLTTTGAFMGTPAYMAPEQFMMLPTDGRTDQFSLCVALYEAIYGHRPFKGRDLAQLMAATLEGLGGLPAELPGVPLSVRQIIARGLAKAPEDRFASMDALVAALEHTRAPATSHGHRGGRRFALGVLAGGGALALGTVLYSAMTDAPEEPAPAASSIATPAAPAPVAAPAPTPKSPSTAAPFAAPPGPASALPQVDDPARLVAPADAVPPAATPASPRSGDDARALPTAPSEAPAGAAATTRTLPGLADLDDEQERTDDADKPTAPPPGATTAAEAKPPEPPPPAEPTAPQ
ncbi:MAG: serine/threonine protein kinase [Nannocystaceae bacterium]|nr:serine/threonine protein kinase [Nannocystaceae bacterium]